MCEEGQGEQFFSRSTCLIAASPAYLEKHGTPKVPMDLIRHKMLSYDYALNPDQLPFTRRGETTVVHIRPSISSNDDIVYDYLQRGELVAVIDDWELPRLTMNIAFQTRRQLPAKVRLFVEALTKRFKDNNYERLWT